MSDWEGYLEYLKRLEKENPEVKKQVNEIRERKTTDPVEYVKNILIKNSGFELDSEKSEQIGETCLRILPEREAVLLAIYAYPSASFLNSNGDLLPIRLPSFEMSKEDLRASRGEMFSDRPPSDSSPKAYKSVLISWIKEFSQVFEGEKRLLIVEESPKDIASNIVDRIKKKETLTDFLVMGGMQPAKMREDREVYISEAFFDYMAGVVLRSKGFLMLDPQVVYPRADLAVSYP
ncbi:hypothetical protein AKJ62_01325 [candidate division MSBL1 archaeon SCGC-AAA259D14]|uniref:Uncharacterized protein n=1 Tax=candidate division MSBL1 archaeon SCGC-AAA259D14 TaxID=1698261 RepID=A0A133U7V8_9EURY|nr:hypothetical protein AKJ62_01325 [candidate division MSBL1 archaeon SCGC-AAA259D14]